MLPNPSTPASGRCGLLAAGQWILDRVKIIDRYPAEESLARILEESEGNGGCAYNLLKDLSILGANFPLEGVGVLGDDEAAARIRADAHHHAIDVTHLVSDAAAPTSYTDVMTVRANGKRTFFYQPGANTRLSEAHMPLLGSRARIFHLGYLGLLDQLEQLDESGRNGCSRLFEQARGLGFITSADMVSSEAGDFPQIVRSCLPHLDYLLLNEFEAGRITGIDAGVEEHGEVRLGALQAQADSILRGGLHRAVIIHFPGGAVSREVDGSVHTQGAVRFPPARIVGSVGAGDAFAAGFLYAVHEGWHMPAALELAVCAAAVSLQSATSSEALRPWQQCLQSGRQFGFRAL